MIVHYKLPHMGWSDDQTMDINKLWTAAWLNDQFLVSTVEEFDYLEAYGLLMGRALDITWDPSMGRKVSYKTTFLWLKDINTKPFNPRIGPRENPLPG